MNAIIYHRVSTVDQNPELARDELRKACAARGLQVVLEIEETGSGANNDRPGLARVLEAVMRREAQAVVVWKLDRFGRSAFDLLHNIRKVKEAGGSFVAITQGVEVGGKENPVGDLILTVLAGVAEFERALIKERTKIGLINAKQTGKHLGRPRKHPNVPTKEQLDLRRAQGVSLRGLAKEFRCTVFMCRRVLAGEVIT